MYVCVSLTLPSLSRAFLANFSSSSNLFGISRNVPRQVLFQELPQAIKNPFF